jgi:hypothetical protein
MWATRPLLGLVFYSRPLLILDAGDFTLKNMGEVKKHCLQVKHKLYLSCTHTFSILLM